MTKEELTAPAAREPAGGRGGFGPPGSGGPGGGPGGFRMGPPRPGEILPAMLGDRLELTAEQSKQVERPAERGRCPAREDPQRGPEGAAPGDEEPRARRIRTPATGRARRLRAPAARRPRRRRTSAARSPGVSPLHSDGSIIALEIVPRDPAVARSRASTLSAHRGISVGSP